MREILDFINTVKAFLIVIGFLTIVGFSSFYILSSLPTFLRYLSS